MAYTNEDRLDALLEAERQLRNMRNAKKLAEQAAGEDCDYEKRRRKHPRLMHRSLLPTIAAAGTSEKLQVMKDRAFFGLPLFRDDDMAAKFPEPYDFPFVTYRLFWPATTKVKPDESLCDCPYWGWE